MAVGYRYANLCGDALLSVAVGAGTGLFVATDATFNNACHVTRACALPVHVTRARALPGT